MPAATPVCLLTIAMIEPPREAPLVPLIGTAPLLAPGLFAAFLATVAVTAVAVRADEEDFLAPQAGTLS